MCVNYKDQLVNAV